jgi:hypothetical protein
MNLHKYAAQGKSALCKQDCVVYAFTGIVKPMGYASIGIHTFSERAQ